MTMLVVMIGVVLAFVFAYFTNRAKARERIEAAKSINQRYIVTWDSVIGGKPSPVPPMPPVKPAKVSNLKPQHKWLFKP